MVYSLSSVTGTINNPVYGNVEFGGGNQTIGQIGYEFDRDNFKMKGYADGGATVTHDKFKGGTVSIQISQTSSKYRELVKYAKWCFANPESAESTLTVRDATGIMQFSAYGVFPVREPNEVVGEEPSDVTVSLISTRIVTEKDGV